MCLWEIDERTLGDQQRLELDEHVASRSWDKAVPNSRDVNQILSPVISDNDGVHSVCARNVSSDHEFLSTVQPILGPGPAALANLVSAVLPLGNDTFQPLAANCVKHVGSGCFEIIRNPDSGRIKLQNRFHDFMAFDKRQARPPSLTTIQKS